MVRQQRSCAGHAEAETGLFLAAGSKRRLYRRREQARLRIGHGRSIQQVPVKQDRLLCRKLLHCPAQTGRINTFMSSAKESVL